MAASQNTHLIDVIATKIHKKPVICFVKSYDKLFRGNGEMTYPIVKVYTQEEIVLFGDAKSLEAEPFTDIAAQQAATPAVPMKEHHFFSPNTAIEEIANTSATLGATSTTSPSPKSSLLFTTECREKIVSDLPSDVSPPTADESVCSLYYWK